MPREAWPRYHSQGQKEEMFLFYAVVRWFQEGEMKFHLYLNEYLNVFDNTIKFH